MRVQVNINDDMVQKIDTYAHKYGVTRSALCSVAVGQYIDNLDNAKAVLNNIGQQLSDNIIKQA